MSLHTLSATLGTTAVMACVASPALAQTADSPSDTGTPTTQKAKKGKGSRTLTDAQLTTVATTLGTNLATLKAGGEGQGRDRRDRGARDQGPEGRAAGHRARRHRRSGQGRLRVGPLCSE